MSKLARALTLAAMLAAINLAGVTAIASWPLYAAFQARLPPAVRRRGAAVISSIASSSREGTGRRADHGAST